MIHAFIHLLFHSHGISVITEGHSWSVSCHFSHDHTAHHHGTSASSGWKPSPHSTYGHWFLHQDVGWSDHGSTCERSCQMRECHNICCFPEVPDASWWFHNSIEICCCQNPLFRSICGPLSQSSLVLEWQPHCSTWEDHCQIQPPGSTWWLQNRRH